MAIPCKGPFDPPPIEQVFYWCVDLLHWQPCLHGASAGAHDCARVPTPAYAAASPYAECHAYIFFGRYSQVITTGLRRNFLNNLGGLPARIASPSRIAYAVPPQHKAPLIVPRGSKYLLRRYLDPCLPPKSHPLEVLGPSAKRILSKNKLCSIHLQVTDAKAIQSR